MPGEWTDADTEFIERKFRIYDLGAPPEFQKFVCGKKLYNYDNLEPSERKLVLTRRHHDGRRDRTRRARPSSGTAGSSPPR